MGTTDLEVSAMFLSSPEPHPCLLGINSNQDFPELKVH